jgi:hypothetical protein
MGMKLVTCPGCGGLFPEIDGPTHRYMESSPGCWAAFGAVLAREYSDPTYFEIHRLTVDAYAVQHPGHPSRQSIQSVGLHLIRLCLHFEQKLPPAKANEAIKAAARVKHIFTWLEPPPSLGSLTVADVVGQDTAETHKPTVRAWAMSAWQAWSMQHNIIRQWLKHVRTIS